MTLHLRTLPHLLVPLEKEQSSGDDLIVQEDAENSSADIFHPSIAKFPKKMTELLLMGKQPPAAKSVDEFMDEIPLGGKRRRRVGRRRLNELSDKHRRVMGEINLCYVRKDFDKAWNLCEDLIKKGKFASYFLNCPIKGYQSLVSFEKPFSCCLIRYVL